MNPEERPETPPTDEILYRCPECDAMEMDETGHCYNCGYEENPE